MKKIILLALCFLTTFTIPLYAITHEGFLVGTPIKTTDGYKFVEELELQDVIESINQGQVVLTISKIIIPSYVKIVVGSEIIQAAPDQKFYLSREQKWVAAHEIKKGDILLAKDNQSYSVDEIEKIDQEIECYALTVQDHILYVSSHDILAHNFNPAILLAPVVTVSLSPAAIAVGATVAVGSIVLGILTGIKVLEEKAKKDKEKQQELTQQALPPSPEKPKKDDDNDENKVKITENDAQHIFRNSEGHFPVDTPESRKLLLDLVSDSKNFLGLDKFGTECYAKILSDGKQLWAQVRKGHLRNGGINEIPKIFHPGIGFRLSSKAVESDE